MNNEELKNDAKVTGEKVINKVLEKVKKGSYAAGDGIETVGKKLKEKVFTKVSGMRGGKC